MLSKTELYTPRLRLIPVSPAIVRAFFNDREELSRILGAVIPLDWPVDPVIMEILKRRPDDTGAFDWADYIYIHKQEKKVIGDGGFKGPPDTDGRVEIGYAIIPEYRNKGLATEGALALAEWAFSNVGVSKVCAETSVNGTASMRVVQKLGMQKCGARHDDEDGDLFCWQITREEYEKKHEPLNSKPK